MDIVVRAAPGLERLLLEEVNDRVLTHREGLYFLRGKECPLWAQNIWLEPKRLEFSSIGEAVKHLRGIQRNWWFHSTGHHRRGALIQEQLPRILNKPVAFPTALPTLPMGAFTLESANQMIYSPSCTHPFPDGELQFVENKLGPPSRAYLKLWEILTLLGKAPGPGDRVLDLGSSPGGWTWVLDQLGAEVLSVDKAPLAPQIMASPRVKFIEESAFALEPEALGPIDWLFSDVICYPERLLQLVEKWRRAGTVKNFVCTIKFQEPTNHQVASQFLAIPGSQVRHLCANKHELTWSLLEADSNC